MNRGYSLVQLEQCFDPVNNLDLVSENSSSRVRNKKPQLVGIFNELGPCVQPVCGDVDTHQYLLTNACQCNVR